MEDYTIMIATAGREEPLLECLSNIDVDVPIHLVMDREEIREFLDDRIVIHEYPRDHALGAIRQFELSICPTNHYISLDDDIMMKPGGCGRIAGALSEGIAAVSTFMDDHDPKFSGLTPFGYAYGVNRSSFRLIGGFNCFLQCYEDFELGLRLLVSGEKIVRLTDPVAYSQVILETGGTRRGEWSYFDDAIQVLSLFPGATYVSSLSPLKKRLRISLNHEIIQFYRERPGLVARCISRSKNYRQRIDYR